MKFTNEQLSDIKHAVRFYQQRHVSINNPRYKEYEDILRLLEEYKDE